MRAGLVTLVLLLGSCTIDDVPTDDPNCFSPTRPQADMSPGRGCTCHPPQPDVVLQTDAGRVHFRCQGVLASVPTAMWFVVED